ncbi:MAG: hypothetical protein KDA54_05940 [Phycisphaerales bacterium]|nr:hypothetical protein [Phycisphaerales bacterium]
MIRWAAVILASLSWMFAFHHHIEEVPFRQWTLVILAVLCSIVGLRHYVPTINTTTRRRILWALVPLAVILLLALPAYRTGPILLLVGVVSLALGGGSMVMRSVGLATTFVGALLLLQSATYWMTMGWTARNPNVPYVGAILYQLFSWLGADVSYSGGRLGVRMMRSVHEFPFLWEHLAIFPLAQIWLAGMFFAWLSRAKQSFVVNAAKLTATLGVYSILRLFVLIPIFITAMLFVKHDDDIVHVEVFWMPWITALTLLPLIPILARFMPWSAEAADWVPNTQAWDFPKHRATMILAGSVACFCAAVGVNYWDPGVRKEGRVLLDEAHSRWERTDNPYTTDWYGHESGYNYYCMAEYLKHFYDLDVNMDGKLTADRLANYDVLILKTPTDNYSDEELAAMEAFVDNGGGLFALGEHTNVFGSSVALNPITRKFGIAFQYNSVFDLTRKWEQVHIPGGEKRNKIIPTRLGVHPIMQDVPFYKFAVSCSIATDSWKVRPVIRSTGLWSLPIDYAAGNFYPHVEDLTYARFGAYDQTVCTTAGEGRVVAFGDSTVYSNFLAFYPGKPEMLLGAVEWLNRTNSLGFVNPVMLVAFFVLFAVMIFASWRLRPDLSFSGLVIACGAGAAWFGMWTCAELSAQSYALPKAIRPVHTVVFDMDHSTKPAPEETWIDAATNAFEREFAFFIDSGKKKPEVNPALAKQKAKWPNTYELPLFGFTQRYDASYEIFYQWVLRLGYYTDVSFDLDAALQRDNPIVLLKPQVPFGKETLANISEFLNRGGSLMILDAASNKDSTASQVLSEYGMAFGDRPTSGAILVADENVHVCDSPTMLPVTGGRAIFVAPGGVAVTSVKEVGQGQIIACGLADRFVDTRMGSSSRAVPTPSIRAVFELEFALMRGLVEKNFDAQIKDLVNTFGVAAKPASKSAATDS